MCDDTWIGRGAFHVWKILRVFRKNTGIVLLPTESSRGIVIIGVV